MHAVNLTSHLERIETFLHRRLEGILSDYLRFGHNQVVFFLLTFLSDLVWRCRVSELHPKNKLFHFVRRCYLCDWEPLGLDLEGLVDHLIDIRPYNQPPNPDTEDVTPPPPVKEDTEENSL